MAYTTIDDPSVYFQPVLFTGSTSNITVDIDMRPDFFWFKSRTQTYSNLIYDTSRPSDGTSMPSGDVNMYNVLKTDKNVAESDNNADGLVQTSTGFIVDGNGQAISEANQGADNMVCWTWKANGGTETNSQSESGSNIACSVQANTTAGFSIITYTGTGGTGHTFLHGLGSAPAFFIIKRRSGTEDWLVYHHKNTSAPETDHLLLNTTDATSDSDTRFDDTAPNGTEIALGNNAVCNGDGSTYVCYAFKEIQGYSKFGSYSGSGSNTDGTFIYLGFKPSVVLFKCTSNAANWNIFDNKRSSSNGSNIVNNYLYPNKSDVEDSDATRGVDFLSNGIKHRNGFSTLDDSGRTYIYLAFASSPLVGSDGTPCPAF